MINVQRIEAYEFRGIRSLSIDVGGENFAICGRNGTGKSGIVDALEFGLTGNISRLSGRGTGEISLKEHAPHVDSRNRPDGARVILTVTIPNLAKTVTIERSVKDPLSPKISPASPEVLEVLRQVQSHPEFALSRRELIRYVISAPGDRAKEVQALLQLDAVEDVRAILQRIANSREKEFKPLLRARAQAAEQLLRALEIDEVSAAKILAAVNARRTILGLGPIAKLRATTSLKEGLGLQASLVQPARISKAQALADLQKVRELIDQTRSEEVRGYCATAIERLEALSSDPKTSDSINRERLLSSALAYVEEQACPVCDTPWKADELKAAIAHKLKHFEEIASRRAAVEKICEALAALLEELATAMRAVARHGTLLDRKIDLQHVADFVQSLMVRSKNVGSIVSISASIEAIRELASVPKDVLDAISKVKKAVRAIPEPTEQDAARDYLTVAQERLEAYREAGLAEKRAAAQVSLTRKIYDTYASVSTNVLEGIYKRVEKDFGELYRFINRDDEDKFAAQLTPSIGKLGFDVDFYGRGFFPPGAYHSEGHQDGMGICLYLALMKHLLSDGFTFAVLDDVLMSVDSAHRREVCNLLKRKFANTQFILTTHDEIWLRHMKAAGLIAPTAYIHFRKWNVDHGPAEWEDRDVWREIDEEVARNKVRSAAALLRHYLEFASAEICHRLRAPVEFRGDAQFLLGDLLPAAIGRFNTLLREAKAAAGSWGKNDELTSIEARETEFKSRVAASKVEEWQINPAVHYSEWVALQARDFAPVVRAHRELIQSFICSNAKCLGFLYVLPERGGREEVRCACNGINLNLRKRVKEKVRGTKEPNASRLPLF